MIRIAIANPPEDGLTRTVVDGVDALALRGELEYRLAGPFECSFSVASHILPREAFVRYAREADLIFYPYAKREGQRALVEEIDRWDKTIYLDGSEPGKNRRLDPAVKAQIEAGSYTGTGRVESEMLARCPLYFRREKPYLSGVLPLPFGIERGYTRQVRPWRERTTDFFCVFGQEEYPPLRREALEALEAFCKQQGLRAVTHKTWTKSGFARKLAHSRVGIAVSGGGFDTFRFWEILGAGGLLLTEAIDIELPKGTTLAYKRIVEFTDLEDFKEKLAELAGRLAAGEVPRHGEYAEILATHSSLARVRGVLRAAAEKGLIRYPEAT